MAQIQGLDARQRPPESARLAFKKNLKLTAGDIAADHDLLDLEHIPEQCPALRHVKDMNIADLEPLYNGFVGNNSHHEKDTAWREARSSIPVYEAVNIPGLLIFPKLLSPAVQIALLEKLLHRDMSNPQHMTNLHPFYPLPYEPKDEEDKTDEQTHKSFFDLPQNRLLQPINPSIHKPLTVKSMLESKLRWATLGGQYDWTQKVYPDEVPPAFPPDLVSLLDKLFPEMKAQAAIVNLYSPGDTLSMHRDVSEECDRGLVSVSIGCEAIFMLGNEDGSDILSLRVRSGDAILMSGSSRFAWHGVPKVLRGTCPDWLVDWPVMGDNVPQHLQTWKGWMANKRINLNVRQMTE